MKINIITLFPEIIQKHLEYLPFSKAIESSVLTVNIIDLKKFSVNKYGSVDDKPYGGGKGMILRIEPIYNALESINATKENQKIILTSASGKKYTQTLAREFSSVNEISIICGRYEGVDARVNTLCTHELSIGNFVLSGGELPALIIGESIARMLPGVLDKEALEIESYYDENAELKEYPQYTRPETFKGMDVPKVLLSGNHAEIDKWKKRNFIAK